MLATGVQKSQKCGNLTVGLASTLLLLQAGIGIPASGTVRFRSTSYGLK